MTSFCLIEGGISWKWIPSFFILFFAIFTQGCSHLFYQPSQELFNDPAQFNFKYKEVKLKTQDGVVLSGWYFSAGVAHPKGVVIQFHGNAENMSTHFGSLAWMTQAGYDFFTFDYRGYGASEGSPSQEGLNLDALAAIQYISSRQPALQIVLYGQSLGGAVLLRALHDLPRMDPSRVRAVIIDSSFFSYKAEARALLSQSWLTYLFQPLAGILISDQFSPEPYIHEVSPIPLLVIHGEADRVVPISQGEQIFKLAREPKQFWRIQDGTHIDSMTAHQFRYRKVLLEYLNVVGSPPDADQKE